MSRVKITKIYDEIIAYYRDMDYQELIAEDLAQSETVPSFSESEAEEVRFIFQTKEDALFACEEAYRTYTGEQKENDLDKLRRYLTDYFNYLMKYELYIDLNKLKNGRTYYVNEKDAPIIKEILLRACSQHVRDRIIGKWLRGRIKNDSYWEIVELSERLAEVIDNIDSMPNDSNEDMESWKAHKKQWITALRIVLRSGLAYFMTEVETCTKGILSYTLPFRVDHLSRLQEKDQSDEQAGEEKDGNASPLKEQFANEEVALLHPALNCLYSFERDAQLNIYVDIANYLESVDFDNLLSADSTPSIDLLKLKSICEHLYGCDSLIEMYPQADKLKEYIKYFISVTNEYTKRIKERRIADKQYHWNKPK